MRDTESQPIAEITAFTANNGHIVRNNTYQSGGKYLTNMD